METAVGLFNRTERENGRESSRGDFCIMGYPWHPLIDDEAEKESEESESEHSSARVGSISQASSH